MLYLAHLACFLGPKEQRVFALMMRAVRYPEIRIMMARLYSTYIEVVARVANTAFSLSLENLTKQVVA